ncbi:MAG: thermonuclease family protein [Erysipelotrichaceae bacterium]|nr:thermonuclease family protein [Erysipelotrichaceae bacterium]
MKKLTLKQKIKRILTALAVVFVLAAVPLVLYRYFGMRLFPLRWLHGEYPCKYVYDGDTIEVTIRNRDVRIRLIGLDTPESVAPEEYGENTEEGKIAAEYLRSLLTGKSVYLEFDKDKYDNYGRMLAYVYLQDGKTMVNILILQEGYAKTIRIYPNEKYADLFSRAERKARSENKGFWGSLYK